MATSERVGLASFIQELRRELRTAIVEGREEALRFRVTSIELELQVVVQQETAGGGGVKFWVLSAEGKHTVTHGETQTVRLSLEPIGPAGPGETFLSTEQKSLPAR